jgi:hypothetical protein
MTSSKSKPGAKIERPAPLRHSHSHDFAHLLKRWRAAAPKAGLLFEVFAKADRYPLLHLHSKKSPPDAPSVYLSAGIHGDEPASTEALITWVERNSTIARRLKLQIFPCLNPWGLIHNKRSNADGVDLNRCYHNRSLPIVAKHQQLVLNSSYDLALILHEDYDALGAYLYETSPAKPHWGEQIIAAMSPHLPSDSRRHIDTSRAKGGIIRRKITSDSIPEWPEAFLLHFHGAGRVFTIETASEFHIDSRVEAHVAAIDTAIALLID